MSEQSNSSNHSKRLIGMLLLITGICLLAGQFLMIVVPSMAQKVAAARAAKEDFATIRSAIDEKVETVVAQEVAARQTADAGDAQELAVVEEMESAVEVEPGFVFVPAVRTRLNVLGVFRMMVVSLVAFILLGVGIYVLSTQKEPKKMDDPPV